jgi:hypothetical protein
VPDTFNNGIWQALQQQADQLDPRRLFITALPEAADLIISDPYAFALASSLARGRDDEISWTVPYDIKEELGRLDPRLIHQISIRSLQRLFYRLPRRLHFVTGAPLTTTDLTDAVIGPCNGDASRLWRDRTATQVRDRFAGFYGAPDCDPNVLILRLEHIYGVRFPDRDASRPMVHPATARVLCRLGLIAEETPAAAKETISKLYRDYPAEIDVPLWFVGRWWCRVWQPVCPDCFLAEVCPRIGVPAAAEP